MSSRLVDYYNKYYGAKLNEVRGLDYDEDFYLKVPGSAYYFAVPILKKLIDEATADVGARALDVGFGTGAMMHWFRHKGVEPRGVDVSKHLVGNLKEKGFDVQLADLNETGLPFEDGYFDIVVSLNVIEHVIDPLFFMSEISRVCKPGGHALISTDNSRAMKYILKLLFKGRFPRTSQEQTDWDCGHLHYFTSKDVVCIAREHGFKTIQGIGVSNITSGSRGFIKKIIFAVLPAAVKREFFSGAFLLHLQKTDI
ncbi:MAG: class I SAM-dependent methyltransferase [bacterium]